MHRQTSIALSFVAALTICLAGAQVAVGQSPSDSADAVAPIPGDYNFNGLVEQGDLDMVLMYWGSDFDALGSLPPTWTNDPPVGIVDQGELDNVLGNWGRRAGAIVPEPASLWLLLAAASGALALRRFRTARA